MAKKALTIIDCSTLIPGPFTSFLLEKVADVTVVKLEDEKLGDRLSELRPTKDGIGLGYLRLNAKKRVEKVNWQRDKKKIQELISGADVLIENNRPGYMEKIGLGFEAVQAISPSIIYCSIAGFPKDHPLAGRSAHDLSVLALSGFLEGRVESGGKNLLPAIQLADMFSGYHTALKILSAVLQEQGPVHLTSTLWEAFLEAGTVFQSQADAIVPHHPEDDILGGLFPCYRVYESKNSGKSVAVASLERSLWIDLCHKLGREDFIPRQFDLDLNPEMEQEMRKFPHTDWLEFSEDTGVVPVLSVREAKELGYV